MNISERLQTSVQLPAGVVGVDVFNLANEIILLHNRAAFSFPGWESGYNDYGIEGAYFIDKNPRRATNRRAVTIELDADNTSDLEYGFLPETTVTVTDFKSQMGQRSTEINRYSVARETGRMSLWSARGQVPISKVLGDYACLAFDIRRCQRIDVITVTDKEYTELKSQVENLQNIYLQSREQSSSTSTFPWRQSPSIRAEA